MEEERNHQIELIPNGKELQSKDAEFEAIEQEESVYPAIALRGLCVFPYMSLPFDVGRERSRAALSAAMAKDQMIFLVTQKDIQEIDPDVDGVYEIGTICQIKQILALPGDNIRVLVEGVSRAKLEKLVQKDPFLQVEVQEIVEPQEDAASLEEEAMMRIIMESIVELAQLSPKAHSDVLTTVSNIKNAGHFADLIAAEVLRRVEDRQSILEIVDIQLRLERLIDLIKRETEIVRIERQISGRVRSQVDKTQREYYLREQMKAIQRELGDKDTAGEAEELRMRARQMPLSEEASKKVEKEIERFSRMQMGSPDASVSRTYIDWILDLPWGKETEDCLDLQHARDILEAEHYGLEKLKERILEYLAIRKLKNDMKGPILCFVGPPGTGKTSIARSIAHALGRTFVRSSLGGVRDEAEIRGHRRTYIGAIPGIVIYNIKRAGTMNPVFLFDEIDKMGADFRGDPASAMLEVLDPEQNTTFRDHYLELDFDLSKVLFVATANSTETIPRPLLDRMEVIEVNSYTEEEKVEIAKRHLIPKQQTEHGIPNEAFFIEDHALFKMIREYTAESGVRGLERTIAKACRKAAHRLVEGASTPIVVTVENLTEFLGMPKYLDQEVGHRSQVGVANGLAWTSIGGTTLSIEVGVMPGTGKLDLTGQLGDVMKESAKAGLTYLRTCANRWGLDAYFAEHIDLHIHIPEGATPKDGPSAGVTMATAMISALTNRPVRGNLAMTGEITLRGRVLPVGGIKEKILAAHRKGFTTVILPKENQKDLYEIPEEIRNQIKFYPVSTMDEVLKKALEKNAVTNTKNKTN